MKKCVAILSILAGVLTIAAGIVFLCARKKHHGFYYSAHLPDLDDTLPFMK